MKPKVLFIGGTGVISSACSELCLRNGFDLWLLNRGSSLNRVPEGARVIRADIRNAGEVGSLLENEKFDAVVDWVAYVPEHVRNDFEIFKSRTAQYVFISSASVYQRPPSRLPVTETEPLVNPYWEYAQAKIACEAVLTDLYRSNKFPVTIVRPSHTYDRTKVPLYGGYTPLHRMLEGKEVIIHGDGTSLWTLTHQRDFAAGFIGLLANPAAVGQAYHITSDEVLSWEQICRALAGALGIEPRIVCVPSRFIGGFDPEWGKSLLGDKAYSMIFDNAKIKGISPAFNAVIPFKEGAKEIVSWYMADEARRKADPQLDRIMDEIVSGYLSGFKRRAE